MIGRILEALHKAAEVGQDMALIDHDAGRDQIEPSEADVAETFAHVAPECFVLPPSISLAAIWVCQYARRYALEEMAAREVADDATDDAQGLAPSKEAH